MAMTKFFEKHVCSEFRNIFASMSDSLFIVIEGLDGSGKSTAARRLKEVLEEKYDVKVTLSHEPNRAYCGGEISSACAAFVFCCQSPRSLRPID